MEDEPPDDSPNWRLWAAEKIGALREMARTNRERIITLEDEVGVDPPVSDDREVIQRLDEMEDLLREDGGGGALGYFSKATSSRRRVISTIVLIAVIGLFLAMLTWLIISLAQNDIHLPFLGSEWAVPLLPTLRRSQLRSFALLYEQEPQDAPTGDDHEEEQKRVHSRE